MHTKLLGKVNIIPQQNMLSLDGLNKTKSSLELSNNSFSDLPPTMNLTSPMMLLLETDHCCYMPPVIQSLLPPTAMIFLELPLKKVLKKKFLSKLVYKNGPLSMLLIPIDTIKSLSLSNSLTEKKCSLYKLPISMLNIIPYISEKINGTLHSMVKQNNLLFHSVMEPTETMLSKTCTEMT